MSQQQGTVVALDRANNRLRAVLDGGAQIIAAYLSNAMPWPLATATFTNQGGNQWLCTGPLGHSRDVLHDDFLDVTTNNGDSPWQTDLSGASTLTQGGTAPGVAHLHHGIASAASFFKEDTGTVVAPSDGSSLWWSCRASLNPVPTGSLTPFYRFGLLTTGTASAFTSGFSSSATSGYIDMLSGNEGATAVTITGTALAVDIFYVFESVLLPGGFNAAWIDGDGPYVERVNVASPSKVAQVRFLITNLIGGSAVSDLNIDWMHVAVVNPVADPRPFTLNAA